MNIELEKEKISKFAKAGIIALSSLLFLAAGVHFIPKAVTVTSSNSKKKLPIYCVDIPEKKVGLSFDAAWGNEDTGQILEILKRHDVNVTFFMTGGWIETYPDDVKAIAAAGHDLANHSENHKQMSKLSKEQCVEEIMKPHDKVKELTGVEMNLFRPPYSKWV